MTLIELMVCIAITGVVMTIAVSLFFTQYKSQHSRKQVIEIQETMPAVVEMLKTDMRQAGWSVTPSTAFFFEDGGTTGSDRIYVNDSSIIDLTRDDVIRFVENDHPGCAEIRNDSNEVDRLNLDQADNDFIKGDYHYVLTNNATNAKRVAKISDVNGNKLELNDDANFKLNTGDLVTPAVAYWIEKIDERWVLLRSDRNSIDDKESLILAEDVVDLQVEYKTKDDKWHCDGGGESCQNSSFNASDVRTVRLHLVTRSRDKVGRNDSCMPLLANRTEDGCELEGCTCGYVYKRFQFEINLENMLDEGERCDKYCDQCF